MMSTQQGEKSSGSGAVCLWRIGGCSTASTTTSPCLPEAVFFAAEGPMHSPAPCIAQAKYIGPSRRKTIICSLHTAAPRRSGRQAIAGTQNIVHNTDPCLPEAAHGAAEGSMHSHPPCKLLANYRNPSRRKTMICSTHTAMQRRSGGQAIAGTLDIVHNHKPLSS